MSDKQISAVEGLEPYEDLMAKALEATNAEEKLDLYAKAAQACTEWPLKGEFIGYVEALTRVLEYRDLETCFKELRFPFTRDSLNEGEKI